MNEPVSDGNRSCVGCRQKDAREVLLRFVADGDPPVLAPDIRRRAFGRGVSVHPRFGCVEAAVRTGALRRGLGLQTNNVAQSFSARELSQSAATQYKRRAASLLGAAQRAHRVALGTEAVRQAIAARSLQLLVVAHDAEGSREELTHAAEKLGRSCLVWSNKQELGGLFGRALLSIVGVLDAGIATELRQVVRCATELAEDA
jgi:ribosomal protein L7Ae-like RNA K-turn-binding protein